MTAPPIDQAEPAPRGPRIVRQARAWLWELTGGEDPTPLVILFLLYFFDEFDTGALNTLAPNVKASFHLTDKDYGLIVVVNLTIVLLFAIPVGHIGDRIKRVAMVVIGALVAGTFSLLTGVVTSVVLLVIVRIGNGIGRLVNDPIHTSLLTDWYQPFHRPHVFATHRNAVQLGAIVGALLAGAIAALVGWRFAFAVTIVPIVIVAVRASRLKEPVRGASEGNATAEPPLPFLEAARLTMQIRSLRRAYLAAVIVGGGLVPLAVLAPLFLDRVFEVGELQRGLYVASFQAATFIGMRLSGTWTTQWLIKGLDLPMRRAGFLLIAVGVLLALLSGAPNLAVYVGIAAAASFVAGVFLPPLVTTQALVAPPRVRSLVFSFSSIFFVIGAGLFFVSPLGSLSDNYGIRWGMLSSAPFWALGGVVAITAARFVQDDTARAFAPD